MICYWKKPPRGSQSLPYQDENTLRVSYGTVVWPGVSRELGKRGEEGGEVKEINKFPCRPDLPPKPRRTRPLEAVDLEE